MHFTVEVLSYVLGANLHLWAYEVIIGRYYQLQSFTKVNRDVANKCSLNVSQRAVCTMKGAPAGGGVPLAPSMWTIGWSQVSSKNAIDHRWVRGWTEQAAELVRFRKKILHRMLGCQTAVGVWSKIPWSLRINNLEEVYSSDRVGVVRQVTSILSAIINAVWILTFFCVHFSHVVFTGQRKSACIFKLAWKRVVETVSCLAE